MVNKPLSEAGWHHWLDGHESEWTSGVGDGQGGLACCNSWGRKESDTTEWLIWSDKMLTDLLAKRWCKSPKPFVYDKCRKKTLVSTRIKDCWFCKISHPLFSSMCNLGYKSPCWKWSYGPCSPKLGLPVSFFLVSFSSFSLLFFLHAKIIGVRGSSGTSYLSGLLRSTREDA